MINKRERRVNKTSRLMDSGSVLLFNSTLSED